MTTTLASTISESSGAGFSLAIPLTCSTVFGHEHQSISGPLSYVYCEAYFINEILSWLRRRLAMLSDYSLRSAQDWKMVASLIESFPSIFTVRLFETCVPKSLMPRFLSVAIIKSQRSGLVVVMMMKRMQCSMVFREGHMQISILPPLLTSFHLQPLHWRAVLIEWDSNIPVTKNRPLLCMFTWIIVWASPFVSPYTIEQIVIDIEQDSIR